MVNLNGKRSTALNMPLAAAPYRASGLVPWQFTFAAVSLIVDFGGSEMARGTVKWFNSQKGYGFIQPQGGGGKDVFVHISAVEKAGLSSLNEGQIVEYDEVSNKGKTSAENLKVQR
jgi:CspA family cold shock protein